MENSVLQQPIEFVQSHKSVAVDFLSGTSRRELCVDITWTLALRDPKQKAQLCYAQVLTYRTEN